MNHRMSQHNKRQKISNKSAHYTVPAAKYPEKSIEGASYAPVYSIYSGDLVGGNFKAVTYKSIFGLKYIERLDLVRNALIKDEEFKPMRITEKDYVTPELIEKLKSEVRTAKESSGIRNHSTDEKVEFLNSLLDDELKGKQLPESYGPKVIDYYKSEKPDVTLNFNRSDFEFVKKLDLKRIKIDRFEDVQNIDMTPYERRKEELASSQDAGVQDEPAPIQELSQGGENFELPQVTGESDIPGDSLLVQDHTALLNETLVQETAQLFPLGQLEGEITDQTSENQSPE